MVKVPQQLHLAQCAQTEHGVIELLTTYRKELAGGSVSGGGLQFPANLRGLPVLFLAMIKNVGICFRSLPSSLANSSLANLNV